MKQDLMEGWSFRKESDSVFVYGKKAYWKEKDLNYNPDISIPDDPYTDTLYMFIHFYPYQNKSQQLKNDSALIAIDKEIIRLRQEIHDSIYHDLENYYRTQNSLRALMLNKRFSSFIYTRYYSLIINSGMGTIRKDPEESVLKEAELIKEKLINYLNN